MFSKKHWEKLKNPKILVILTEIRTNCNNIKTPQLPSSWFTLFALAAVFGIPFTARCIYQLAFTMRHIHLLPLPALACLSCDPSIFTSVNSNMKFISSAVASSIPYPAPAECHPHSSLLGMQRLFSFRQQHATTPTAFSPWQTCRASKPPQFPHPPSHPQTVQSGQTSHPAVPQSTPAPPPASASLPIDPLADIPARPQLHISLLPDILHRMRRIE